MFVLQQESERNETPQHEVAEVEVDLDGSYLETIEKKKPTPKRTSTPDHNNTIEHLR